MFPEGKTSGLYHTADASLWFFHAADRYIRATGDAGDPGSPAAKMLDIIDYHMKGTDFGIGVDPADGLLRQGAEGYQLTWMDAKVDDWVVTPRRGKAVEINALWYNALCVTAGWLKLRATRTGQVNSPPSRLKCMRASMRNSGRPTWATASTLSIRKAEATTRPCDPTRCLVFRCPTRFLPRTSGGAVLDIVRRELVTPVGLRSLAPSDPRL